MLTPSSATIAETARLLLNGGVAVIPTDTVYGIAAHPSCPEAVARIQMIKGRPHNKPIALLAATATATRDFGATFPAVAERLAEAFWPGALTLVLPCGDLWEGFRVPAHDFTRSLLSACGGVLRVTSANLSGAMPATCAVAALQDVGLEADLVIDDGFSPGGVASTVVKIGPADTYEILREGAISCHSLMQVATHV